MSCTFQNMCDYFSLANFDKWPTGEFVEIKVRLLQANIDAEFSFAEIKNKINYLSTLKIANQLSNSSDSTQFSKGNFLALDISVPHQKGTFLLLMR